MSLGILSIKNIFKKLIFEIKNLLFLFFALTGFNYERLSNQRTKGRSSNTIRYHSSSNHKRCLLAICRCLIFWLGRLLYVNQSLWLPGEAWFQEIMGRLAQHGKKINNQNLKCFLCFFFSYFYLLFNTIKIDFNDVNRNKSRGCNMREAQTNFFFQRTGQIWIRALWQFQLFIHHYIGSIC